MAKQRVSFDATKGLGSNLRRVLVAGVEFRKLLRELALILEGYEGAGTDLAADTGVPAGLADTVHALVREAAEEVGGTVEADLRAGDKTSVRKLLDLMG